MESKGLSTGSNKAKKLKRREILEKKKAVDELIKEASLEPDHLSHFPPFRHYNRNGLSVHLQSGRGNKLSSLLKQYIQSLLKSNMEGPFGSEWPTEEKIKRRDMVAPEAQYIFVLTTPYSSFEGISMSAKMEKDLDLTSLVGFVHYRFVVEEDVPVVYVYELQLEPRVQGKGLGKFLMQLIELIARKNQMGAVVLTVQKANISAMNFYTSKLRYVMSCISPSRVNPLMEKSYEILCKAFEPEAKAKLEVGD